LGIALERRRLRLELGTLAPPPDKLIYCWHLVRNDRGRDTVSLPNGQF
jgi:hypothetical protein